MRLAVLQTRLTGGGFQGTCLLEAVFRDDAANLSGLCGCGISPDGRWLIGLLHGYVGDM